MNSLFVILSPLALLLPAVVGEVAAGPERGEAHQAAQKDLPPGLDALPAEPFAVFRDARRPQLLGQVRIEQRVIVRISPGTRATREQMMASLRRPGASQTTFQEEKLRGCIPIADISAVQPAPEQNRLLLFMRDRYVLSAALEKACSARDYYSGFYVERSEDGQLCANRELLQSRAGASCRVAQLNRLVAVRD